MTTQLQHKHNALLARLGEQAEALTQSDGWRRWLSVASRFHRYSFQNQLLILNQMPSATRVAGFRTWQSFNRTVRKGEKGIAILAPRVRRVIELTGEEKNIITGFGVVYVFDIAQTEGEPLPTLDMPEVVVPDEALFTQLCDLARAEGFSVSVVDECSSSVRGWFSPEHKSITVVGSYGIASMTRTMLHELAHAFDPEANGTTYSSTRDERELVAESAAYLVGAGTLDIEMDAASSFYVSAWGGDVTALQRIANKVLTVASRLDTAVFSHLAVRVRP